MKTPLQKLNMKKIIIICLGLLAFVITSKGNKNKLTLSIKNQHNKFALINNTQEDSLLNYKDSATVHLFNSLKALSISDYIMFGMANALTISYNGGPKHSYNDVSDCKDITGAHPAFIESDFMWYTDKTFKENDIQAMAEANKRGIICGYCWHLRGLKSNEFYAYKNNLLSEDKTLVKDILANNNRDSNISLNWYLTLLDKEAIPVFQRLGFPIIFRPFHEMTGNWFWWGTATCTPEEYVQLYRLTVDYLRSKGIKNLLYAWAPDKSTNFSFYPGDDYVDVIGYDGYDVGIASYHSIPFFLSNLEKLTDYAVEHNKIAAITEIGGGNQYPEGFPEFWTKHVLNPLKKNVKASRVAWMMTWYNSDWNHDHTNVSYIPYLGVETKTNGLKAIDDFKLFYKNNATIFADEMPNLYLNDQQGAFIYPSKMMLNVGDSITLIGGSHNNWYNETSNWKSSNTSIVTVDSKGLSKAISAGTATITLTTQDGKYEATCEIETVGQQSNMQVFKNDKVHLFPNPSCNQYANIDFGNDFSSKSISVYSLMGERVLNAKTTNNKYQLNNSVFPKGTYLIQVLSKSNLQSLQLVVQ